MANDSSTGGFLPPNPSPAPLQDAALADFFQGLVVGITGMEASLVRPRWQPEPPDMPVGDWAAIGIMSRESDTFAYESWVGTDANGMAQLQRHEVLKLQVSFYGPNADDNCGLFKDGLQVSQNREVLQINNMGLVETQDATAVPTIIKEKWVYRVDLNFSIKRQIIRTYPVFALQYALIELIEDVPPVIIEFMVGAGYMLDKNFELNNANLLTPGQVLDVNVVLGETTI
jgi:hypothetical protein